MIQRIQTIYMLLSTILMVACCFLPLGRFLVSDGSIVSFNSLGYLPLLLLLLITSVLTFTDILLFRQRALQMRIMSFTMILLVGWYALYGFMIYNYASDGAHFRPEAGAALPFVCIVLNYLSFRGILKDELLVRESNRLR